MTKKDNLYQNTRLPEDFKKYFWDCDFDTISFHKNIRLITERILNYGDENSIKWLFEKVNPETLKAIIKLSRNLNNKTKNYWNTLMYE